MERASDYLRQGIIPPEGISLDPACMSVAVESRNLDHIKWLESRLSILNGQWETGLRASCRVGYLAVICPCRDK